MNKKFTLLTLLVLSMFGLSFSSLAQTTDLIISEYAEGSSNNKYIELYNGTGATIDLSNYEMWKISNGGAWPEATTSLSGMLLDGDVIVIANSSADTSITNLSNATIAFTSATYFNGDDAVGLAKDDGTGTFFLIDAVGTSGPDPGSGWDVNGTTNGTANYTLVRHDTVCSPDTNWTTAVNNQWTVYPQNTWTYAGSHTASCSSSGPVSNTTDLLISEYAEGSSNNKYIELYNGTGATIDLSDYEMWKISNGGAWPEATTSLSGMLLDGDVIVIANSSADTSITNLSNATIAFTSATYFNGDDAVGLAKDDGTGTFFLIDAVGTSGPDPGSGWDVNGTTNGTANYTLVRHDTVCSPDTNWTTVVNNQWTVYPQNTWTYAGSHTASCGSSGPASSDTTKPAVIDGIFTASTQITVVFSEPVTAATAQNTSNYVITPGITISSAVLSASLDSVNLTLVSPGMINGTHYFVTISNVTDTSSNANVMDPFTTDFYFNNYNGTDLIITEIYHSQASGAVQDIDYFELYNSGSTAISLGGLSITSGVDMEIDTAISIAAGGYFIFVENIDSFNLAFPTVMNAVEYDNGSLSGGGETITIENSLDDVICEVSYQTSSPWPSWSNTQAIELCDVTTDYTDGTNWYYSANVSTTVGETLYGTPGSASSCAALPVVQMYTIDILRTVDADGISDSVEVYCGITGVVYSGDFDGNNGYTFVIMDETDGITVHTFSDIDNYVATVGDELRVVGTVKEYNGLTQFRADSIQIISTGNCIPFPRIVSTLDESTESNYIEIKNVILADTSQWPAPGSNGNVIYIVTEAGAGDTLVMRLDRDTKIQDTILTPPLGVFNVIGTGSQFTFNSPAVEGYQIQPSFITEIDTNVYPAPAGVQINELAVTNNSTFADDNGDYYQWTEIYNGGSSTVNLSGYFLSIDSMNVYGARFPRCFNNSGVVMGLDAGDYDIGFLDNDGTAGPGHFDLTLDILNPFIGLYTPNGILVNGVVFTAGLTVEGYTFGAKDDDYAQGAVTFTAGTPEETNKGAAILSVISVNPANALNVYPNPTSTGNINFSKTVSITVYSITGQTIAKRNNITRLDVSSYNSGIYIIETTEGEIVKMIVK